ncbi:hypothetical protein SESBI_11848 [Sesbania bispinosa]|nr:hypothetical protein SESBI_11848 [Sesbania bispinosa]
MRSTSTHPCIEEGGDVGAGREGAEVVERERVRIYEVNSKLRDMASKLKVEMILVVSLSRIVEEGILFFDDMPFYDR